MCPGGLSPLYCAVGGSGRAKPDGCLSQYTLGDEGNESSPPRPTSLLQERVARYLVLANLVFPSVDPPSLKVLLHAILLVLQMQLVAAARPHGAHGAAEDGRPRCA